MVKSSRPFARYTATVVVTPGCAPVPAAIEAPHDGPSEAGGVPGVGVAPGALATVRPGSVAPGFDGLALPPVIGVGGPAGVPTSTSDTSVRVGFLFPSRVLTTCSP